VARNKDSQQSVSPSAGMASFNSVPTDCPVFITLVVHDDVRCCASVVIFVIH
jgi:hypothetical protein